MTAKTNGKTLWTAEDLKALQPLTAGDFYWGHKHADRIAGENGEEDDPQDLIFHTVHHAAVRAGLAKENDLFGFLDRVELNLLSAIFGKDLAEETEGPLAESSGT